MRNVTFLSHTIGDVTLLLAVLLDEPLWRPRAPKFIPQSGDNERLSGRPDGLKERICEFRVVIDGIVMAINARGICGSSFDVLVDAQTGGIEWERDRWWSLRRKFDLEGNCFRLWISRRQEGWGGWTTSG